MYFVKKFYKTQNNNDLTGTTIPWYIVNELNYLYILFDSVFNCFGRKLYHNSVVQLYTPWFLLRIFFRLLFHTVEKQEFYITIHYYLYMSNIGNLRGVPQFRGTYTLAISFDKKIFS